MGALMNRWMKGWMDGMAGWMNPCIDEWTDQLMDRELI